MLNLTYRYRIYPGLDQVEQRGLVAVGQTVILPVEEGGLGTPMKQETSRAILGSPRSTH